MFKFSISMSFLRNKLQSTLFRRCISTSIPLRQQFTPRFSRFGQPQTQQQETSESPEENANSEVAERFSSSRPFSRSTGFDGAKPATHPFPEELNQDYGSLALYQGASDSSFPKEIVEMLQSRLNPEEIEIRSDGNLFLPESRYRRMLNKAFGPGGWCLVPRGAHSLSGNVLSREYALYCQGRYVSQARGHAIIGVNNPAMATEGVRSNALMRLCKDLGVANELWDPDFVSSWKSEYARKEVKNGVARWSKVANYENN